LTAPPDEYPALVELRAPVGDEVLGLRAGRDERVNHLTGVAGRGSIGPMSAEVIASIVTAAISAAASVIAAVIQAGGKQAPPEAPVPPRRRLTATLTNLDFGKAPRGKSGVDGVWLALVLVLAVESVVLATQNAEFSANLNSIIIIPAVTLVMALARPIGWGYAAGAVTILHGVAMAASTVLARGQWESAPQVFLLSFIANALLVSGVAFLRTKAKPGALGGVFAALGVMVSAWLFLPMLAPRRPPEEPEHVEMQPDPDAPHHVTVRPPRIRPDHAMRRDLPEKHFGPERHAPVMDRRVMFKFSRPPELDPDAR